MDVGNRIADAGSYFRLKEHSNIILAHIALMSVSWAIILPLAVMLSIARSRFQLLVQSVFLSTNALGLLLGVIYNHQTPNLYENEKHSSVGWVITCFASVWFCCSMISAFASRRSRQFHLITTTADTASSSFCYQSRPPSSASEHQSQRRRQGYQPHLDPDDIGIGAEDIEEHGLLSRTTVKRFLSQEVGLLSGFKRTLQFISITSTILDRILLPLGFICIVTGVVVYSGIFQGSSVFNGLAHFIKGGIFFWYGLLTFGRWTGCFAEFGWAWNQKAPKEIVGPWSAMMPSTELIESAVICFYGASNIWLEHLSNPGGKWTSVDLEHVSITVMFFGGGLLGMLIESKTLLNLMVRTTKVPRYERISFALNPTPALVIFLLGSTMDEHHHSSMVSNTLHMQWGKLFMISSLARITTYAIQYLRPPMSYLPQRPPTEIITSFCLIAGGIVLMISNKDTVKALEYNSLDAIFVFNITTGFTTILMAWALVCLAIKGWAQSNEVKYDF